MTTQRFAVIGTGAIGGLYGARLAAAGRPVTFVGRSDVATLRSEGLVVTSPEGDLVLDAVTATDDPATVGPVDVVLVTIKTTGQAALAELLPPLMGPDTIVVLMQNGFGLEADVADLVPGATVLGGMCFVCATRTAPGHIAHLDYGAVTLGEHTGDGAPAGVTAAVTTVADALVGAGIEVSRQPDLLAARWRKLVWNMPFNGLSVVLDTSTDALVGTPRLRALVRAMMDEVVAASAAHGHPAGEDFAERMIANTEAMRPYAPSMKLDHDARRPMELAAIFHTPLQVAAGLGVAMPRLSMLADQLHFLDARNRV